TAANPVNLAWIDRNGNSRRQRGGAGDAWGSRRGSPRRRGRSGVEDGDAFVLDGATRAADLDEQVAERCLVRVPPGERPAVAALGVDAEQLGVRAAAGAAGNQQEADLPGTGRADPDAEGAGPAEGHEVGRGGRRRHGADADD